MNRILSYLCRLLILLCLVVSPLVGPAEAIALNTSPATATPATLTVFRSPTCGCCGDWVSHMQAAGFQIDDHITADMDTVKQTYDVSEALSSCHTALINGYVIEGHVPATDVQRLLHEKPDVVGITAPGMPMGSPGMEMGDRVDSYTVYAFTADNKVLPFARHS